MTTTTMQTPSPLAQISQIACPTCNAQPRHLCKADGQRTAHVGMMAFHTERVEAVRRIDRIDRIARQSTAGILEGDTIRFSKAIWSKRAVSEIIEARKEGWPTSFRKGDISHHQEIVGVVVKLTDKKVSVERLDTGEIVTRMRNKLGRGFENRTALLESKPAGWSIDECGALVQTEEARKAERRAKQIADWKETIRRMGEGKARKIAVMYGKEALFEEARRGHCHVGTVCYG